MDRKLTACSSKNALCAHIDRYGLIVALILNTRSGDHPEVSCRATVSYGLYRLELIRTR